MNILIVNGSPRARFSVTLQSCLYLEKRYAGHRFAYLNVGAGLDAFEKDMRPAAEAFARAGLIVFAYPVYAFLVPSQLLRFLELMRENALPLGEKYVTQLSTSRHFFDMTAHRFLEDNFHDLGMRVIHGLSADMEDLLTETGRQELESFFEYAVFCAENGVFEDRAPLPPPEAHTPYESCIEPCEPREDWEAVIVGDLREGDEGLRALIKDFSAACPGRTRFVNLADFPFRGGCLGCLRCTVSGKCVYHDGFDRFLREKVLSADAVVYAFTLRGHSMGARFKMYDDRQFCLGQRAVAEGKPVAYLVNGDLRNEENLRTVLQARADLSGSFLAGFASDAEGIRAVSLRLGFALEKGYRPPRGFYGVGGRKLLRDLVWLTQGLRREEHRYYRSHGLYDFPQRRWGRMLRLRLLGALLRSRRLRRLLGDRLNEGMLAPYKKVIEKTSSGRM
jgi:multimeric flavodoxin WrbA